MLDKILGVSTSHTTEWLAWRWSEEHPLLHTIIEVANSPYIVVALVIIGIKVFSKMTKKYTYRG